MSHSGRKQPGCSAAAGLLGDAAFCAIKKTTKPGVNRALLLYHLLESTLLQADRQPAVESFDIRHVDVDRVPFVTIDLQRAGVTLILDG